MGSVRYLTTDQPVTSLDAYRASGGGEALAVAARLGVDGVLDELEISGLRGRGGAGFPTAVKWRSIATAAPGAGERFVVANGAEGEPGTFKDRHLLRHNPYLVVEGLLVAALVMDARRAYIAMKASFHHAREAVVRALGEIADAGWAPEVEVAVVEGPDEYLFGEEKGLLEVIEGEDPLPRLLPPYVYGLFTRDPQLGWSAGRTLSDRAEGSNPTLVNNVETLANVVPIVRDGGEAFRARGTPESPGTFVATVSGDTVRHGVGEFEMGTPLAQVLDELGGGTAPGRSVRYVLPGMANPVLRSGDLGVPSSYEGLEAIGSGLGTGGFIVYDDTTDPIELAAAVSRFLSVESCGQCPACKLGCSEITSMLAGDASGELDLAGVSARLRQVTDAARCYLPTQEQRVVGSLLADIRDGVAGLRRDLLVTKIVDLDDDRFVLDERQRLKNPDWTYGTER